MLGFLHMSTPSPFSNSSIFSECESQLSSINLCIRVNTRHIQALHLGGNGYNIFKEISLLYLCLFFFPKITQSKEG